MVRVDIEDLHVVTVDKLDLVDDLFLMSFSEEVVVFVVDNDEKFIGLFTKVDYLKTGLLNDKINRNPIYLVENGDATEEMARKSMLSFPIRYIPVVDGNGRLFKKNYRNR